MFGNNENALSGSVFKIRTKIGHTEKSWQILRKSSKYVRKRRKRSIWLGFRDTDQNRSCGKKLENFQKFSEIYSEIWSEMTKTLYLARFSRYGPKSVMRKKVQ